MIFTRLWIPALLSLAILCVPGCREQDSVSAANEAVNGYEKLDGCRYVPHRNNDGDSFYVNHQGRTFELRLYFVDTPETYLSHSSQRERVADQGKALGGLDEAETLQLGKEAAQYTRNLLLNRPFTVYTYWEKVRYSDRIYGFAVLPGSNQFLSEGLVEQGFCRIYTKGPGSRYEPVPTPEGKSFIQHRNELYALERKAKRLKVGAWK